ncbi:hypothetical protein ArsFIN_46820 (plasmid) [Arsenophonus nasoniae]|uniref:Uncharacterized protein n=1 Tax=Arsenophonus nasoniae TaxID=638 RepID=A0A4P7L0N3_9GAMM|nr:hypothetical protein ArsFIN_46820 [Arsenophonus nasoniae]
MTFDRNALPKIDFFKKDLYLYFIYLLFFY